MYCDSVSLNRTGTQELRYSYQLMTKSIDQEIKWIKLFVKSTMQMNDFVYHMSIMLIHIISK